VVSAHPHANAGTDGHGHYDAHAYPISDRHPHGHTLTDTHADRNADVGGHAHLDADRRGYRDPNA
jgi:hypothetical protein